MFEEYQVTPTAQEKEFKFDHTFSCSILNEMMHITVSFSCRIQNGNHQISWKHFICIGSWWCHIHYQFQDVDPFFVQHFQIIRDWIPVLVCLFRASGGSSYHACELTRHVNTHYLDGQNLKNYCMFIQQKFLFYYDDDKILWETRFYCTYAWGACIFVFGDGGSEEMCIESQQLIGEGLGLRLEWLIRKMDLKKRGRFPQGPAS